MVLEVSLAFGGIAFGYAIRALLSDPVVIVQRRPCVRCGNPTEAECLCIDCVEYEYNEAAAFLDKLE